MACTSLIIHHSVSDCYFADWQHCWHRRLQRRWLVDVGNKKNEARFTFSQIHQYLQYGTYPSDFQKSEKKALQRDLSSSRVLMAIFTIVGGGIAICLLPHYRFSVLSCIFYSAGRPKVSALVQDRRKTIVASIYDTTVHVILLAITLIILYFGLPTCKLTEFEVSNIIYCMVMAKYSKTKKKSMGVPADFMEGSLTSYKIGDPRVPKILGNWGIYHGSTCLYLTLLDFTWP